MKLDGLALARIAFSILPLTACAPAASSVRSAAATTTVTSATGAASATRPEFLVGGRVTGLEGIGLVLRTADGDEVKVDDDGKFVFGKRIEDGSDYAVTVAREPISPVQSCAVERGAGTIGGKNALEVRVVCTTATFDDAATSAVAQR